MKINKIIKKDKYGIPLFLKETILNCTKCPLSKVTLSPIVGTGVMPAGILLIGESPNVSEEMTKEVMNHQSKEFLDKTFQRAVNLIYFEQHKKITVPSYFITNMICCRATDEKNGNMRFAK